MFARNNLMRNSLPTLTFVFTLPLLAELPKESLTLVEKLEEWEGKQQSELDSKIAIKRAEVVKVLRKQLESTTKSGELEGALAIREEIERLEPKPKEEVKEEAEDTRALLGEWVLEEALEYERVFLSSGEFKILKRGKDVLKNNGELWWSKMAYKQKGDDYVIFFADKPTEEIAVVKVVDKDEIAWVSLKGGPKGGILTRKPRR